MTFEELQKIVFDAGIVGAGGAGFPTNKKLSQSVKQIVLNAAECEPLMMVDHYILKKHFKALVEMLRRLVEILGADEAIIGIKGKNLHLLDPGIVKSLENTNISIKIIPDIYPVGDEVVLTYETTGKIIPEGAIPLSVGVMVINVETVYNIHKAVDMHMPVTEKYIIIGGDIKEPVTVKVPVGMKIKELLDDMDVGDLTGKTVINGGPMMGRIVDLENDVVTKTVKGLLIFPTTHHIIQRKLMPVTMSLKRASAACCECTMCSDLCPRYLLGYDLRVHKTLRAASHSEIQNTDAFIQNTLCCGCGVCTVIACQQMLDPQKIAMTIKGSLGRYGLKRENNKTPEKVRDIREARLVSADKLIDRLGIRKYVMDSVKKDDMQFTPKTVYIALKQNVGAPAEAIVKKGDRVKLGQAVAVVSSDKLGTTMHASIDGKVREVNNRYIVIDRK